MRRFAVISILMFLAVSLTSVAWAGPPSGKGKPPKPEDIVIGLDFQYSGPDEPEPADSCVFAEIFSWNANVKGTFQYTVYNESDDSAVLATDTVSFPRPGSQVFFEFSITPAFVDDDFVIRHEASLFDRKGRLVAEFDDAPGTTLTCNAWGDNP